MKIPKARKLPSGNWFIQLRIDGQSISITEADEDTCVAKAMAYKTGILKAKKNPAPITLSKAIDKYIEAREKALSPSTIAGYRAIQRTRFARLMSTPLASLNKAKLQRAVNEEANICSAKTLTNSWRFLASVIYEEIGERYDISLPTIIPNERPYLAPEQIQTFLVAIRDTEVEVPALLGLWSLRRSEIMGLKWSSVNLKTKTIRVENTVVVNEHRQLEAKPTTKNRSSRRTVPIVDRLHELLTKAERTSEYVCVINPESLRRKINAICRENDLPEIGFHGLRHSFASLAYSLGVPEKVAMEIGGWANDATMKKIYTHIANSDLSNYSNKITAFFNASANENANENQITA